MTHALHIGKTAETTGLSVDTIRYYQKAGLVRPPARTSGGYRLFTEADIDELQFIGNAQALGFSLAEIKELVMVLRNQNPHACREVHDLLEDKLTGGRQKIVALRHLEGELIHALRRCERSLKAHAGCCPVIDNLHRSTKKKVS